MPSQFIEVCYKGRIIIIGVKWLENPGHYKTDFTIWGKKSGSWEIFCQNSLGQVFGNKDNAFYAGNMAARNWIDLLYEDKE